MAQQTTLSPSALPGRLYGSFAGKGEAIDVSLDVPGVLALTGLAADYTFTDNIYLSLDIPGILELKGLSASLSYTGIVIAPRTGGRSKAAKERKYPRRIKIEDEWITVRSYAEEQRVLQAYVKRLEEQKIEASLAVKKKVQKKIYYNISKIKALNETRRRETIEHNNRMIVESVLTWL